MHIVGYGVFRYAQVLIYMNPMRMCWGQGGYKRVGNILITLLYITKQKSFFFSHLKNYTWNKIFTCYWTWHTDGRLLPRFLENFISIRGFLFVFKNQASELQIPYRSGQCSCLVTFSIKKTSNWSYISEYFSITTVNKPRK